jgi:hypothetical protein
MLPFLLQQLLLLNRFMLIYLVARTTARCHIFGEVEKFSLPGCDQQFLAQQQVIERAPGVRDVYHFLIPAYHWLQS